MAMWRITLEFTMNTDGWSETYFAATTNPDIAEVSRVALKLGGLRAACVPKNANFVYSRISDDDVVRDSIVFSATSRRINNQSLAEAVTSFTALHVRLESGPKVWRALFMRPLPIDTISATSQFIPTPVFGKAVDGFLKYLTSGDLAIKCINPFPQKSPVIGWALHPPEPDLQIHFVDATLSFGIGVIVGNKVTLQKFPRATGWNGVYTVVQKTSDTVMLLYRAKAIKPGFVAPTGTMSARTSLITPINRSVIRGVTHRIQGRPFGLHRGRARARVPS